MAGGWNVGDTVRISRVGVVAKGTFGSMYITSIDGEAPVNIRLGDDVEVIKKAKPAPKVGDVYSSAREVSISSLHDNAVVIDTDGHPFAVGDDRYMERDNGPYTVVYLPPED